MGERGSDMNDDELIRKVGGLFDTMGERVDLLSQRVDLIAKMVNNLDDLLTEIAVRAIDNRNRLDRLEAVEGRPDDKEKIF
jgi:hypothetical protein